MIVDNKTVIDLRYRSQPLPEIKEVQIPYFYIDDGVISRQDLRQLQQSYKVVILTKMSETELLAAEMLHYQSHRLSMAEARIIILAKQRELQYLIVDAVLKEVCCQEGVSIVEYNIAKA